MEENAGARRVEIQECAAECARLTAELRVLTRLVRAKERLLLAALRRLDAAAPATGELPGLERAVGEPVWGSGPPSG